MTRRSTEPVSELTQAAEAFAAELSRFERLTDAMCKGTLGTQKQLEQSARLLSEIAECEGALEAKARALVETIHVVRERQQAQAEAVQSRARELEDRTRVYQQLMERYASLGRDAGELNAFIQSSVQDATDKQSAEQQAELITALDQLQDRMSQLAESAERLATDARDRGFGEIAHQSGSLRQQLLAVRNKVKLARGTPAEA